ncbi:hypothetical protein C922_02276 [Plasmodium inui San Antonio 1]|uniref:TFIIS central domain-containing protein n=1 Tax=Plasmodium inui San Antonio 1 TaxID=1237626 RepID=W7AP33_9APIC|nr:hypothetical protein C922_02276 [Plasmodium inui San Antonio 1]EUD67126.1 hypothetical protein C922_02276 [Plasmodium inui San Antonio 1]
MGQKGEAIKHGDSGGTEQDGECSINGERDEKEQNGDVVEPIQFVDVNLRNIFDLDITELDIKRVNNHMKLSDISQLYYYLNKNSFCYTSEERPYISNMLQLKSFFSSNDVENYEILEQLKQHDARENSGMRKFDLGRVVARSKLEETEMMGMSRGKRGLQKVRASWNEYGDVTQMGGGDDDSGADVQTDVGDEWGGCRYAASGRHDGNDRDAASDRNSDDGGPLCGTTPKGGNNQRKRRHHTAGEAWHTSASSTNSCHSSESLSSTSSYSFCSSTSSSSPSCCSSSSSSSCSLSAFSPNRANRSGKKATHMSNLKILDVIKKYNENLEKMEKKKKKKIKSQIGKLHKYDTVSIQGHSNQIVMSQIYKFLRRKSSVSIIGQLIYSSSDCKKFLYNNFDCHMNRWNVLPCLGYLNDISEQQVLHRIQVYTFYEFLYLFDEFPLCCQHNRRFSAAHLGAEGSRKEGATGEVTPGEANHSGPCEYDEEIVFNSAQREKKNSSNRRDQTSCSFRVFYYEQFLDKNARMVPEVAKNCISINRSTGEDLHFYVNSNVYITMRETYNVFCDPNHTYVLTHKRFEYLYFFCFSCDTYYDINIFLCHLLYSHRNGFNSSDSSGDFTKMSPFVNKYKKTYDIRIKRQRVKQTDIYFICPNCILNNVYHVMEHLSFFFYFCDLVNSRNHNFLIYNEYMKNIFQLDLPFFSLYNVPKEEALLNAQKKKMPLVEKGKNLPAQKGTKRKKTSPVCANGKRKSNRSGNNITVDSSNTTSSSNTVGSERSAVRAQALVVPAPHSPHSPPTRDRHCGVAERGAQKAHRNSRAGMASEEGEKGQLGGEANEMEDANEVEGASKVQGPTEVENPSNQAERSRVKGELASLPGQAERAASSDGQQEPLDDNPEGEEAGRGKPSPQGQHTFKEETGSSKRRSDRKRKKKKEDDDELFDEACLSNESEDEDTFEDDLAGHTDEDIVEENQILFEEVYSGDSDFCTEEQASGRKRRKKTGKKGRPPKRESAKGKKSATKEKGATAAGGAPCVGTVPCGGNFGDGKISGGNLGSRNSIGGNSVGGNSVGGEKKKEEDYKTLLKNVNRACKEDDAANRSISKYTKVINKIKHALDKEETTIDTKELSERIVKGVIHTFNDKMEIKMKLFSICSNLIRKDNSELRKKILNGIIHATDLAHMDSSDLAPSSLKNKRKEHERKYFYENIYLRENFLDLKNIKNQEEEEVFHHPSDILAQKVQVSTLQEEQEGNHQGNGVHSEDSVLNGHDSGVNDDHSEVNGKGIGVNDEGLIHPCDGKKTASSHQSDEFDPLKHRDSNGEEKNVIPSSNSNANLSDSKQRRKGSSGNEDQEKNLCLMIPPMEKYSFEFTYHNLKGAYEHMPKYASSPILTFLDNSYNRIVSIIEASKNEQL